MKVDLFDFDLPAELIASKPLSKRDEAKLLLVPELLTRKVKDLVDILPYNTLIILNNTKVIPARIRGISGGREYEAMLHKNTAPDTWLAFIKNSKKLSEGDRIAFGGGALNAVVKGKKGDAGIELKFDKTDAEFFAAIEKIGATPLPPYIKRETTPEDAESYQTVYASVKGAVAAPTAGLHFTPRLMERLKAKGMEFAYLTLHVGAGTFQPVKAEDTIGHVMHSEYGIISPDTARRINAAKRDGRPILAVGTTTLRLLEAATGVDGDVKPFKGETDIFITPGYEFRSADMLMTNFHLPRSTLFMLVSAFAGMKEMRATYEHAKKHGYRFYSYGDSSLLKRKIND
ncbi:MAG: tRNA preQ1(34) S-adenosylmethionine ribosyltransferase-isomerase QueA [Rickettsiales bacterium]|jgi:S-adenosylmethionine:tRNA ribosyltransferase-isomerase|nr:tRNA preQ1(34) S-adenosylmethionine ribosyltransferase-isomerase QueA [Rickettsiales bacterium]